MNAIETTTGRGGLPLLKIQTPWSTAEIYLHGAHVAHFQKNGEPPLLFVSRKSHFAAGKPIRGGVPICYPWFGNREGDLGHGFVRTVAWELVKSTVANQGAVTLTFRLPEIPERGAWKNLRTEFTVTVAETLTMELISTNESGAALELENCLHTYFHVGDLQQISLSGLQNAPFQDNSASGQGARKTDPADPLRITQETNRIYTDNASTVEVRDEALQRTIRVEKAHSQSTVIWNPWTTQKMPDDFDPAEHRQMVCVESANVKQNKITLAPGQTTTLKVVLSSGPLK